MWQAVGASSAPEEEDEMSSEEYVQVSRSLGEISARIERLEADVGALRAALLRRRDAATYVVWPATRCRASRRAGPRRLARLYEANAGVIGPDPNRIYPGQVLVVP